MQLICRQQFRIDAMDAKGLAHFFRRRFAVTCQHDCFCDAIRLQRRQCICRTVFNGIIHHQIALINTVFCHINHRTASHSFWTGNTFFFHQTAVPQSQMGTLPLTGDTHTALFRVVCYPFWLSACFRFKVFRNGTGNGMVGKAFSCCCHFQQSCWVFSFDFCDRKLPFCEGACFVKYDPFCMAQSIQHIAAFDEDAILGCGTNASKITQWHRQHQRTRTGYNQENQRTPNPLRKSALPQNGRYHCQKHCQTHHHRGIYPCKTCDEFFCLGFPSGSVFH